VSARLCVRAINCLAINCPRLTVPPLNVRTPFSLSATSIPVYGNNSVTGKPGYAMLHVTDYLKPLVIIKYIAARPWGKNSSWILTGRPFGGTAVLVHKRLVKRLQSTQHTLT